MTTGAALLAALDAALPIGDPQQDDDRAGAEQQEAGLAAAVGLNELLADSGRGWDDVMREPGTRLAKLCGRLGSSYAGEREAAYVQATRLLQRAGSRWSGFVRLPPDLADSILPVSLPALVLPPEDDWLATIRVLEERSMQFSEPERELLQALGSRLAEGHAIDTDEARRLRDMWWLAEVNPPCAQEAAE